MRHPRKGVELLLDAVKRLRSLYPDIEIILVGSLGYSGYGDHMKRRINELGGLAVIRGQMNAEEIADELTISIHTVYSYRNRILEKMKLKSNVELTQYVIKNKLIEL